MVFAFMVLPLVGRGIKALSKMVTKNRQAKAWQRDKKKFKKLNKKGRKLVTVHVMVDQKEYGAVGRLVGPFFKSRSISPEAAAHLRGE